MGPKKSRKIPAEFPAKFPKVKGEVKRGKEVKEGTRSEVEKRGEECGEKRMGGKGPESTLKKPLILRYPCDLLSGVIRAN